MAGHELTEGLLGAPSREPVPFVADVTSHAPSLFKDGRLRIGFPGPLVGRGTDLMTTIYVRELF